MVYSIVNQLLIGVGCMASFNFPNGRRIERKDADGSKRTINFYGSGGVYNEELEGDFVEGHEPRA